MFNLLNNKKYITKKLLFVGKEVQKTMDIEFLKNIEIGENSPLNQEGLKEGFSIIKEYIDYNEYGLAFEHILYMIEETDIIISNESKNILEDLSNYLKIPYVR